MSKGSSSNLQCRKVKKTRKPQMHDGKTATCTARLMKSKNAHAHIGQLAAKKEAECGVSREDLANILHEDENQWQQ